MREWSAQNRLKSGIRPHPYLTPSFSLNKSLLNRIGLPSKRCIIPLSFQTCLLKRMGIPPKSFKTALKSLHERGLEAPQTAFKRMIWASGWRGQDLHCVWPGSENHPGLEGFPFFCLRADLKIRSWWSRTSVKGIEKAFQDKLEGLQGHSYLEACWKAFSNGTLPLWELFKAVFLLELTFLLCFKAVILMWSTFNKTRFKDCL